MTIFAALLPGSSKADTTSFYKAVLVVGFRARGECETKARVYKLDPTWLRAHDDLGEEVTLPERLLHTNLEDHIRADWKSFDDRLYANDNGPKGDHVSCA